MNKNKGIWIVIAGILVIGILITLATSSFVKSREEVLDPTGITGNSNAEFPDASEEGKTYAGTPELFSADMAAPQEAPVQGGEAKRKKSVPAPSTSGESSQEQPAEARLPMNQAAVSDRAEPIPQRTESSDIASTEETVISPVNPDTKNRSLSAAAPSEGAAYYQKHLADLDMKIKKMRDESVDSNTYSMKALADKELKLWNREQNAIYETISDGLGEEEKKGLEASQQAWTKSRDAKAEEAAKKYSGGSLEELEYTASLAESTRARAYDLVTEYMAVLSSKSSQ